MEQVYYKYLCIHNLFHNINQLGRVGKCCLQVIHNNILYINQILVLCIIYKMGNIWDLKQIYFQLKLIHHLYLMKQTTTYHNLYQEFQLQIKQFQFDKQYHHKIQSSFRNLQEKYIGISIKMSLSQKQQFQITMYLENINPQPKNTRYQMFYYNHIRLMDNYYLEQYSMYKVQNKIQNLLVLDWMAIQILTKNKLFLIH
ncbi:unnamed protein product [Paramecium primaurelia]|uniref:Uncharacterized protein n=1 Tax=Paramecium primaurelia TaxID=5886 RepID=A0A8S1NJ10_PARPR|nr:unnamed protein product [Paramecium primaurelia]